MKKIKPIIKKRKKLISIISIFCLIAVWSQIKTARLPFKDTKFPRNSTSLHPPLRGFLFTTPQTMESIYHTGAGQKDTPTQAVWKILRDKKLLKLTIQALDMKNLKFKETTSKKAKHTLAISIKTPELPPELIKDFGNPGDILKIVFKYNTKTATPLAIGILKLNLLSKQKLVTWFKYPLEQYGGKHSKTPFFLKIQKKIQKLFLKIMELPYVAKILHPYLKALQEDSQESQALKERIEFIQEDPNIEKKTITMPGAWQESEKKVITYPKIFE